MADRLRRRRRSGWFGARRLLSRAGRLRQEAIERDLPDFLDILAVSVRAGLGYRYALRRVAESLGGPVGEEMLTVLRQIDLGATAATRSWPCASATSSESLKSFVGAQLQAEELGVPLSEALNDIAPDMRRIGPPERAPPGAARGPAREPAVVTTLIVPGSMILILLSMFFATDVLDSGVPRRWLSGSSSAAPTAPAAGCESPAG